MSFEKLLADVRACQLCSEHLPAGPRPVLELHPHPRILIAGQAPGQGRRKGRGIKRDWM